MSQEVSKRAKFGGRQKGTPNKKTEELMDMLKKNKCNPAEFLAHVQNGDWEAIGLETPEIEKIGFGGVKVFELAISMEMRVDAAKTLMGYLYPKRKAIDHSISDDQNNKIIHELAYKEEQIKAPVNE